MGVLCRVQPCRGVAKALAHVVAPPASALFDIAIADAGFQRLGRPAEFASSPKLSTHQRFIRPACGVSQTNPNKVIELVNEDAAELSAIANQVAIEHHPSLAEIAPGVNRVTFPASGQQLTGMSTQFRRKTNVDYPPVKRREFHDSGAQQPFGPFVRNAERVRRTRRYFAPPGGAGAAAGAAGCLPKYASLTIVTSNCFCTPTIHSWKRSCFIAASN